jgi:hypothetical protein
VSVAVGGIAVARRGAAIKLAPGLLAVLVLLICAPLALLSSQSSTDFSSHGLPAGAQPFLAVYQDAARAFDISPFLLMAVHEDETNYSTAQLPGVADGINTAGCCAGPMQFSITASATNTAGGSGGTWAHFADSYNSAEIDRPADYPGRYRAHTPNVYDSYDAIYAAAAYFRSLGAGPQLDHRTLRALASYKGTPPASLPYARHDYDRAIELASMATTSTGELADLTPVDGDRLEQVIGYANQIDAMQLPYCYGGGHGPQPGPTQTSPCKGSSGTTYFTSAKGIDCSGSVRWLLSLAGYRDPGPIASGDFPAAYAPGPGTRVTIWSNAVHVFLSINGRAWGTANANPNSGPGWAPHPTAGFVASHPAGL